MCAHYAKPRSGPGGFAVPQKDGDADDVTLKRIFQTGEKKSAAISRKLGEELRYALTLAAQATAIICRKKRVGKGRN